VTWNEIEEQGASPRMCTRHILAIGLRGDENLTAQSEAVEPSKGLLFTGKKIKLQLPIRFYDVNTKFESPTTEKASMKCL
jgi:hypothetical protein